MNATLWRTAAVPVWGPPQLNSELRFTPSSLLLGPPKSIFPSSAAATVRIRRRDCSVRSSYYTAALLQDARAAALVVGGAYSLVRAFDALTKWNFIEQSLSRKLVHVLSGLLFMSSWPIFSSSAEARYFAAIVPLVNGVRLIYYGLSFATDEGLIKSVTREGKPEELLRGPLYYVMALIFCTLVFWRNSPLGIVSVAMMSGGDGFADIVGRRYGATKLPYNRQKSWVGSISMFIFGFISSTWMLYYFSSLGYIQLDWRHTVEKIALVSLAATVVESLPTNEIIDDNISVPLSSMMTAFLLFSS